jgi:hypothetical protein
LANELTGAPDQQRFARYGLDLHGGVGGNRFTVHGSRKFLNYVFTDGTPNLA